MGALSYRLLDGANSNTAGGDQKNCAVVAGFRRPFRFSNMNRHKQQTRRKTKTESKQEKPMQTKQSVTNSNNHQSSTACREKHAAMNLPIRSTLIVAFGLLSTVLPVSQTAQAQDIPSRDSTPVVFQAAGINAASIQSTVDAFRARLGNPNNLNNPGPLRTGRREINWDGGNPNVLDTTAPVTPFNVFLNTRGSQFTTPGIGLSQAPPSGGPQSGLAVLFSNPSYAKAFR